MSSGYICKKDPYNIRRDLGQRILMGSEILMLIG